MLTLNSKEDAVLNSKVKNKEIIKKDYKNPFERGDEIGLKMREIKLETEKLRDKIKKRYFITNNFTI